MTTRKQLSVASQVRNSFRPFYRLKKKRPFWKEMQSVRRTSRPNDYPAVMSVAEGVPAYSFPGFGNTFPTDRATVPHSSFRRLEALAPTLELRFQAARLNHHSERLVGALASLAAINGALSISSFEEAERLLDVHTTRYGLSLAIAKKELLLSVGRSGLPGLARHYKAMIHEQDRTAWAVLCHYLYDLMDPTFNVQQGLRAWLGLASRRLATSEWYALLIQDDALTRSPTDELLSAGALRFSSLSLLDLALFLWKKKNAHPSNNAVASAMASLRSDITGVLERSFSALQVPLSRPHSLRGQPAPDIEIYRTSFFYDDIADIAAWRSHIHSFLFPGRFVLESTGSLPPSLLMNAAATSIALNPRSSRDVIAALRTWECNFLLDKTEVTDQKFLTAAIVAESLRRLGTGPTTDASAVAHLLASTEDVHLFVSTATLLGLLASEPSQAAPLLTFVLRELLYRRDRSPDNELERRLAFMEIFHTRDRKEIEVLLDDIAPDSQPTAMLLARTCTRTFLERLYLMMSSLKDVLETRLRICRWLAARSHEQEQRLKEECDALDREIANLDARSDLDSTRVHVDEDSLREWFEHEHEGSVARYTQTVIAEGPHAELSSLLAMISTNKERTTDEDEPEENLANDTRIGSEFLLASIFSSTLHTFAEDRSFGLDAYLSRRIRHGTLSGQILTPLAKTFNRLLELSAVHDVPEHYASGPSIRGFVDEWRRYLTLELDHVRKEIIQLKTDAHPQGLIRATWRTSTNVAHLDAMLARVRGRVIETHGSYDVFPDLFALCWDCLESDLAQLRLYMLRDFLTTAIERLNRLFGTLPISSKQATHLLVEELRNTLQARVQDVCGWFIRPVFRRDRYSLRMLVMSTLSIVRELDASYAFSEAVTIPADVALSRGGFDVFSDILFVLVGNAAKHGRADGPIHVEAKFRDLDASVVELTVSSQVVDQASMRSAEQNIGIALAKNEGKSIHHAAVEEGFSGLRKLVGLLNRIKSPHLRFGWKGDADSLTITFQLELPAEITVLRERG